MDEAARFTAEHSVMEAGIEIRSLKHKLELAEKKIEKLEKKLAEIDDVSVINYGLDIGKSLKEEPELRSVISEKYNKFGEDA